MIGRGEAQAIAAELADPADADWNKIALFAKTGKMEPGLVLAVEEASDYAARYLDTVATTRADALLAYVEAEFVYGTPHSQDFGEQP